MSALHQAIKSNNLAAVKRILEEKPEIIDRPIFRDLTALQIAAREGRLEIVLYLIERGATVDGRVINPNSNELRRNEAQKTPLYFALERGHIWIARVLFFCGANLATAQEKAKAEDNGLFSFADLAALFIGVVIRKQRRVLDYLQIYIRQLSNDVVIQLKPILGQLVTLAAALNHTDIVKMLLDLNMPLIDDGKQRSALYWAMYHDNAELITLLEKQGCNKTHALYFLEKDNKEKFWQYFRTEADKQNEFLESFTAYKKQQRQTQQNLPLEEFKGEKLTGQELDVYQAAAARETITLAALLQTADIPLSKALTRALNNYDYVAIEQLKPYLEKNTALLAEVIECSPATSFLIFNGAELAEYAAHLIQHRPQHLKYFLTHIWSEKGLLYAIFRKENKTLFKTFCQQYWHCSSVQNASPTQQALVADCLLRNLQDEFAVDFRSLIAKRNVSLEKRIRQAKLSTSELGLIVEHCNKLGISANLTSRHLHLADKMCDEWWQHAITYLAARDYANLSATSRRYHRLMNDPLGNKARLKRNKEEDVLMAQQLVDTMERAVIKQVQQTKVKYGLLIAFLIIFAVGGFGGWLTLYTAQLISNGDINAAVAISCFTGSMIGVGCTYLACRKYPDVLREASEVRGLPIALQARLQTLASHFNLQLANDTLVSDIKHDLQTTMMQLREEIAELETTTAPLQLLSPPQPQQAHVLDIAPPTSIAAEIDITTPLLSTVLERQSSPTFFAPVSAAASAATAAAATNDEKSTQEEKSGPHNRREFLG